MAGVQVQSQRAGREANEQQTGHLQARQHRIVDGRRVGGQPQHRHVQVPVAADLGDPHPVEPAVAAAREVLDQTRAMAPDTVQVKFGVKVTGTAHWLVAKAATEGNFEITLTWGTPRSA